MFAFIHAAIVLTCSASKKSQNEVYLMQRFSQRCFSKVVTLILRDGKEKNMQFVNTVPKSCRIFHIKHFHKDLNGKIEVPRDVRNSKGP